MVAIKNKKDFLEHCYFEMLRIRMVEEAVSKLFSEGHIMAPVHLSIGQEAVAVGIMQALEPGDTAVSTHRCHGHYLAKGGDLKKMFAELCGRETGSARGHGGTMHLLDENVGFVVSAPIVASSIPFAVGIALASKMKGEDSVAVAFFGDGAVEEGVFWESVNFASVQKLPVVFVCENNLYATHSPITRRQPSADIAPRIRPHRIRAVCIDGNDVVEVFYAGRRAAARARHGQPYFIEAKTYRTREHWGVGEDWNLGYRSREDGDAWMARDPLKACRDLLQKTPDTSFEEMEEKIRAEIAEAVHFALSDSHDDPRRA